MRCLRAALLALLIVFLAAPAARAQARPPQLGEIPDAPSLEVPYFYPTQDAAVRVDEWGWPGRYLYIRNNVNWLLPNVQDLAPRLFYRDGPLDVSAGSQLLVGATPFHDAMSFQGARVAGASRDLSWTLWGGHTENVDERLLSGTSNPHDLLGATVGWRPTAYQSWGASFMQYAPETGGALSRSLAMLQGYYSDRSTYGLRVAFGQDLGPREPGEAPSTRRAWRVTGTYGRKRLSASVDLLDYGRRFGPPQGLVDLRGQLSINALAQYRLDRNLVWTEIYRQTGFEAPDATSPTRTSLTTAQHRLSYYPSLTSRIEGGYEHTSSGAGGSPGQNARTFFVEGSGYVGTVLVGGDARFDTLPGDVHRTQIRVRGTLPVGLDTHLFLEQAWFSTGAPGGGFDRTWQSNVGLRALFPDERGFLQAQYQRQQSRAGGGLSEGDNQTGGLAVLYRPIGRLYVGGGLNLTSGASASSSFLDGRVRWLFSRHSDVELAYNFRSGGQTFVVDGQLRQLEDTVTLRWRHSFGGPIQAGLHDDLLGRMVVQLQATPAGADGPALPLAGVAFDVAGRFPKTDARGRAVAVGLDPGAYTVKLAPGALGPNYVLQGPAQAQVRVPAGESAHVTFRATAYASVYAVTWNDAAATGQLENAYTPIAGIRVRVEPLVGGETPAPGTSTEDGNVSFSRLRPGRYRVSVDPASILPGLVATTPTVQDVPLAPGEEHVASFGFQGFGTLEGRALAVPRNATEPREPLAGVAVMLDGKEAGRADAEGRFLLKVPAGLHTVTLEPGRMGGGRYLVGAPIKLDVKATEVVRRDLVVEAYGRIRGQLMRRSGGKLAPLKETGVVVEFSGEPAFVYTDEQGAFVFERLPVGRYTLKVDPTSLPAGLKVETPSTTVDLRSGEERPVEVLVR